MSASFLLNLPRHLASLFFPKGGDSSVLIYWEMSSYQFKKKKKGFPWFLGGTVFFSVLTEHTHKQTVGLQRNPILTNKAWEHLVWPLPEALPIAILWTIISVHGISPSPKRWLITCKNLEYRLVMLYSSTWVGPPRALSVCVLTDLMDKGLVLICRIPSLVPNETERYPS